MRRSRVATSWAEAAQSLSSAFKVLNFPLRVRLRTLGAQPLSGCTCGKPKSGRIGDAARQPGRTTRCVRFAEPGKRPCSQLRPLIEPTARPASHPRRQSIERPFKFCPTMGRGAGQGAARRALCLPTRHRNRRPPPTHLRQYDPLSIILLLTPRHGPYRSGFQKSACGSCTTMFYHRRKLPRRRLRISCAAATKGANYDGA
jgi:hypothetical protein